MLNEESTLEAIRKLEEHRNQLADELREHTRGHSSPDDIERWAELVVQLNRVDQQLEDLTMEMD